MMNPLVTTWHESSESKPYFSSLLKRNRRRTFGILEKPSVDPSLPELKTVKCKLFLVGKAGVGKTSTIARLSGRDVPPNHEETLGIHTTNIYWPVKFRETGEVMMYNLEMWDSGERYLHKFDYILSACVKNCDAILFFFSITDRHSWDDLPHLIARTITPEYGGIKLAVGTRFDCMGKEVTHTEMQQFVTEHSIDILPTQNVNSPRLKDSEFADGRAVIQETGPFMEKIISRLVEHQYYKDHATSDVV